MVEVGNLNAQNAVDLRIIENWNENEKCQEMFFFFLFLLLMNENGGTQTIKTENQIKQTKHKWKCFTFD